MKALSKRTIKKYISLLTLVISGILVALTQTPVDSPPRQLVATTQPGLYKVTKFYDGDTIAINMEGLEEKVRMIGVDTPETHDPRKNIQCFGVQASEFTKNLIGDQTIRLEADPTNSNRDRYNRLLRYVYLPDETLVNAEIIKQGYGFAYTSFPFTKLNEFRDFEKSAQLQNRGLWNSCQPQLDNKGYYRSNDANL